MPTNYWLDLFSGETWDEFLAHGGTVSGFRESQKKTAQRIKPGDRLVCYVVGISRFIGILEVTSDSYFDMTPIDAHKDQHGPLTTPFTTLHHSFRPFR